MVALQSGNNPAEKEQEEEEEEKKIAGSWRRRQTRGTGGRDRPAECVEGPPELQTEGVAATDP